MTGFSWERWSRAAGIGFVVTYVIGFIVLGEPPKVNASADEVVVWAAVTSWLLYARAASLEKTPETAAASPM